MFAWQLFGPMRQSEISGMSLESTDKITGALGLTAWVI